MAQRSTVVKYVDCTYRNGTFLFTFQIDDEELVVNLTHSVHSKLPQKTIESIGFNLGMCYLMDLAEITLTKKIWVYKKLPPLAANYWMKLYEEQIIEKCYALQISTKAKHVTWEMGDEGQSDAGHHMPAPFTVTGARDHAALCLTGGKESLSLLKTLRGKKPLLLFFLNPETNTHRQKVYEAVKDAHLTIKTISNRQTLFAPYEERYQGLHCSVDMAHLVFNTMLYADICDSVLIGNEYSANFPNDIYEGSVVNHQFVKTMHFAEQLNNYIHEFVTPDFTYRSPFFGLYEYKIADLLFKDDDYLDVWTSCNETTPDVNFCSNCPKCAFTYLIARTKKDDAFLARFFSRNMLEDVPVFQPLMDFVGKKPLDCVGDKVEVWVALEQLYETGVHSAVTAYYAEQIRPQIERELPAYKQQINTEQRVPVSCPEDIHMIIRAALGMTQ